MPAQFPVACKKQRKREQESCQTEKLEEKIRENPGNVALKDFEWLIRRYGDIKEGGKHPLAITGNEKLTYKRENPVKPVYVKYLLTMIDSLKKR